MSTGAGHNKEFATHRAGAARNKIMIRVTIEMIPHGDETRPKKTLGVLEIANDGTGDLETGHYVGTLHAEYTNASGRRGRVENFNRRGQSVWSLVGAFLKLFGHPAHSPRFMRKL